MLHTSTEIAPLPWADLPASSALDVRPASPFYIARGWQRQGVGRDMLIVGRLL